MHKDEFEINNVYNLVAHMYYKERRMGTIHNTFIANPALRKLLKNLKGLKILDIGCGFGEDLKFFLKAGAEVTGIELNKKLIKIAKQDPHLKNIKIIHGSIYSLGFSKEFDICFANLVLDQVKNLKKALIEINKALKDGGRFIFSIAHPLNSATDNYTKPLSNYFTKRKGYFYPESMKQKIPYYFRNFNELSNTFCPTGFLIKRIIEPKPIKRAKEIFKNNYKRYNKFPDILIMELLKTS